MDHFAGLDVSVKETSICIVDDAGKIVREVKVASEPEALLTVLKVHVKTIRSQKLRMLLTHRKLLQSKAIAIENDLRGTLRNFGLKVGIVGKVKFEARIRELVENLPDLAVLVEPMLVVRRTLREQIVILHRRLLAIVRDDEGVGPVVALTYRATVL
jgi:transposase